MSPTDEVDSSKSVSEKESKAEREEDLTKEEVIRRLKSVMSYFKKHGSQTDIIKYYELILACDNYPE